MSGRNAVLGGLALLLLGAGPPNLVAGGRPSPDAAHLQASVQPEAVPAGQSLPGTIVVQFPLVPSGVRAAYPKAAGLVTIVGAAHDGGQQDTVTIDVWNLPPHIRFTVFYTELAGKPFGNVEYVADLTTRGDGRGEAVVRDIGFIAYAMDARHPGTSTDDLEGPSSGTNLEHLGVWFASLQDARRTLEDDTLTGTIFDGGAPPQHAGPQALTDGQTTPRF